MDKYKEIYLEYKGYTAICKRNPKDRNRFYGRPYPPGHPDEPMDWYFAGDNRKEVEEMFRSQVDDIIKGKNSRKNKRHGVLLMIMIVLDWYLTSCPIDFWKGFWQEILTSRF